MTAAGCTAPTAGGDGAGAAGPPAAYYGPPAAPDEGLLPLAGTGWSVWRDALLRTTGFPVDGMDRFTAPDAARVADAVLAGEATAGELDTALAAAVAACSRDAYEIAGDARFAAAVAWQNRNAVHALRGLRDTGPAAARNSRRRQREIVVCRYWQRYTAKNDTIGFFGPTCWVDIVPGSRSVRAEPDPVFARDRLTVLEPWALEAVLRRLAADPEVCWQLPPARQPHVVADGPLAYRADRDPVRLSPAESAVLAACDGRRPAAELSAVLPPLPGLATDDDVRLQLDRLVGYGLVDWPASLPVALTAELVLHRRLAAIGDERIRNRALAVLHRLGAARDRIAAVPPERPDELLDALSGLDGEFERAAGRAPVRRPGQVYASRTVCVQDTVRGLRVSVGDAVLAGIARPLDVLLRAGRWLSRATADAFEQTMLGYHKAVADTAGRAPLDELWFLGRGAVFGSGSGPLAAVAAEFGERIGALLGLDAAAGTAEHVTLDADALADAVDEHFPPRRAGWRCARFHCPDLHLCRADGARPGPDGYDVDDFFVVLGELHSGWPIFDSAWCVHCHPRPDRLGAAILRDLGPGRLRMLLPVDFERFNARTAAVFDDGVDLVAAEAAPVGPAGAWPSGALGVVEEAGALWVTAPDGHRWPLVELFSDLLASVTVDAFKVISPAPYTPRVSIGRLVVGRRTWRTDLAATGLSDGAGGSAGYLAVRRLRARLGLPERVYVTLTGEPKPVYADLTSPLHAESLAAMARAAARTAGPAARVVISEMLPGPEHAWVPDAAGARYHSELRLQLRDAVPGGRP